MKMQANTLNSAIFGICVLAAPLSAHADAKQEAAHLVQAAVECRLDEIKDVLGPSDILSRAEIILSDPQPSQDHHTTYERFELAAPVRLFGVESSYIGIYRDWIFSEVPRDQMKYLAKQLNLEKAPVTSEVFLFSGGNEKDRGFIGLFDDSSRIVFGFYANDHSESNIVLAGCNYLLFTREEFLQDLDQQRGMLDALDY